MLTGPKLLAEIERFLRSGVCSESYFGTIAAGDSKLVSRLRQGQTVTLEKAERIMTFIEKAESPDGAGWVRKTPAWVSEWRLSHTPRRVKRAAKDIV